MDPNAVAHTACASNAFLPSASGARLLNPTQCQTLEPVLQQLQVPSAWLALSGHTSAFVQAGAAPGLLQFAVRGRHALVLGDTAGCRHGRAAVEAAFLEHCRAQDLRPVWYQVEAATAARCTAAGQRAYALGEEARVPLTHFTLEGGERKRIRQNVRKLEQEGVRFELHARPEARCIAQCLAVSADWLRHRGGREKRYSLGRASVEYLAAMPLATVWQGDRLLAFANVLQTADRSVLSVDLMRQVTDAPRGCMDLLFARLMEWGRTQGYAQFSLGLTPLSGEATTGGSRYWPTLVRLARRLGERHYGFAGLRRYKDKWHPQWQPRYVVVPRRRDLLPALIDLTLEISGGKRALLARRTRAADQ